MTGSGTKDTVHVVLASDANYLPGLEVAKATMVASCSAPERLEFHVFDEHALERLPASSTAGLPLWNGSLMPYLRLWLPELLPTVDWVVYSDVDTIWDRDVCELWDLTRPQPAPKDASRRAGAAKPESSPYRTRKESPAIYWVRDMASMRDDAGGWIGRVAAGEGMSFDWTRYACSGICVLNLAKMRAAGFTRRVLDLYAKYGVPKFPDQDVLNALFNRDGELLPPVWGAMGDPNNLPAPGERCVYHLTGCGRHFHDRVPPAYPPQYQLWWNVRTGAHNVHGRSKVLAALWLLHGLAAWLPLRLRERVVRQWFFAKVLVATTAKRRDSHA